MSGQQMDIRTYLIAGIINFITISALPLAVFAAQNTSIFKCLNNIVTEAPVQFDQLTSHRQTEPSQS